MLIPVLPPQFAEYQHYLDSHPQQNYGMDPQWYSIILEGYGKKVSYWVYKSSPHSEVEGIVALVPFRHFKGTKWVGMPYMDFGGILANNPEIEKEILKLLTQKIIPGQAFELRLKSLFASIEPPLNSKCGMFHDIQGTSENLWKALDAKVRNQVRKAEKSGVRVQWGKEDHLDDFYRVFSINMRDLGSPVHRKEFLKSFIKNFKGAEIGIAHFQNQPIGGLIRLHWKNTMVLPWASTLKEFRTYCPNNLLYWSVIEYAYQCHCQQIDFGRSTVSEGTYKFKTQWLAKPQPLYWYEFNKNGELNTQINHLAGGKLAKVAEVWSHLPLPLANWLGPKIRGSLPA